MAPRVVTAIAVILSVSTLKPTTIPAQPRVASFLAPRQNNYGPGTGIQVNGGTGTTINLLPQNVQACSSPHLQITPAVWPACSLEPVPFSGMARLDARMRLTFRAATPRWANSPYNFYVELLQGDQVLASKEYVKPNPAPSESEISADWAPTSEVSVVAGAPLRLTVRVTARANWTYRSGLFSKPPDTVEISNFQPTLRVPARPAPQSRAGGGRPRRSHSR